MAVSNEDMLAMARELPIPVPWDREAFIANLSELRGRPIRLVPTDTTAMAGSPCGLWLTREHEDVIAHEIGTSPYHADQIICHEVGHMMLGHDRAPAFGQNRDREYDLCRKILPAIDPRTIQAVLGRSNFDSTQERDAEMFANILMIAAAEAADEQSVMGGVFLRRR
ncbi:hypothetical protein ACNUDN_30650 [Mycobacterium sp. smrl_JER01]|uniref:hypothetical protein n=1 Tax=Mycobacterium sp. smrl_JER01 TaxID=3402633 RepID=UPI003AD6245B